MEKIWNDKELFERAKISYELKNYHFALELLEKIKKKNEKIKRLMGLVFFEMYEFEKAKKIFEKIGKKNVQDLILLGLSCMFIGKQSEAKKYIKEAYKKDKKISLELLKDFYYNAMKKYHEDKEIENILERLENERIYK